LLVNAHYPKDLKNIDRNHAVFIFRFIQKSLFLWSIICYQLVAVTSFFKDAASVKSKHWCSHRIPVLVIFCEYSFWVVEILLNLPLNTCIKIRTCEYTTFLYRWRFIFSFKYMVFHLITSKSGLYNKCK